MDDLPNGFTGFAKRKPGFVSAGDAIRSGARMSAAQALAAIREDKSPAADGPLRHYADDDAEGAEAPTAPAVPFSHEELAAIDARGQRWAWVEIDLSAIRHNVVETRRKLHPGCRLMAVVKADAYGHGAVQCANTSIAAGAEWLAVATVPEALELRDAGITARILILAQPPATSIPLLLAHDITPTIYDPAFAVAYGEAADLHGMKAPYHLAVNTGMNRIGVRYDDVVEFIRQVNFHRALVLEGVFTHYATADCPETLDFHIQVKRFVEAVNSLAMAGIDPGIVHSANSAAILRYPDVHFDMVRLGISLYGFHPCPETVGTIDLHPAMSVHARITDTRLVPVSEGVSYGLHYRSPGSVLICTIPIGYADGLRRGLSSNTDVIYQGNYYRQVGNICMDQCMFEVDLRNRGMRRRVDPQVGEEVLLVGEQGAARITIDEMAEKLGTIQHEISIGFAQRMPRIFT